jgi:uncharacterized membrane protein
MTALAAAGPANTRGRLDRIDILRALAMLWMTIYHFCYDLDHFGLIDANFTRDPFWYAQRTAIVGLFVFTAGISQAVAWQQGQGWPRFWRRWAQVAGAALLVTAGSALVFPDTFIYFGILHGMAAMLIVARLTAGWGRGLWLAGALAIAAKFVAPLVIGAWPTLVFLNLPGWNVLGFVSRLPMTQDYVPLLPWLGAMWWGLAAGQWVLRCRPQWMTGAPSGGIGRGLAVLGRWSLSYYLLHQPVMMGLIALVLYLVKTG